MASYEDIACRYAERVTNPSKPTIGGRNSRMFISGDTIYSYGHHFHLADTLRDKKGNATGIILNGDTYSITTSGHQSTVRSVLARKCSKIPQAIIPHSALRAAGIRFESIIVLDAKPDGWHYTRQQRDELPSNALKLTVSDDEVPKMMDSHGIDRSSVMRGDEYVGRYDLPAGEYDVLPDERGLQLIEREGNVYFWYTGRHWLGESLISAKVSGSNRRVKFMSGFDRNERRRLYFFCQLPATTATTVDQAMEALKPEAVILAEGIGRYVDRQGDIFAIPMPGLTTAELKKLGGRHAKRSQARKGLLAQQKNEEWFQTLTAAEDVRFRFDDLLKLREARRTAVFGNMGWNVPQPLSGSGWNSNGRNWKVADLNRKRADAVGRHRAERFRDILQDRTRAAYAASSSPADVSLIGTSHTCTEVMTMPDGTQYGKGTMYHDPRLMDDQRDPDHARRKLADGKMWHLIQKNTVPTAKTARRRSSRL